MKVNTTRFGSVDVEEDKILNFPSGVPGFPHLKRYFLMDYKEPIKWLHAVDDPDIAFIVTDPFSFFPDYSITVGDDIEKFLEIKGIADIVILVILAVSEDRLNANLKAPIIVSFSNLRAVQIILDNEGYSFKSPLPDMTKK